MMNLFESSKLKTQSSNQIKSNSNLSLPSDSSNHLEYLSLSSILIPILGSHLHGSLVDWQNLIFCLILFIYIFNLINLPWQILKCSQFIKPIDFHQLLLNSFKILKLKSNPASSSSSSSFSSFKFQLRFIELISIFSLILSPFLSIYLLKFLYSTLNPNSKPLDSSTINLFLIATSFKPIEYLLSRLRQGSLFGKPIHPTSFVSNRQIEFIDLISQFEEIKIRSNSLEKRLASDPELESLRTDTELILGELAFQLNQRTLHLDRSLNNEISQMLQLIKKLNHLKQSIETLMKEIKHNIQLKEDEKSWAWDLVLNLVQKAVKFNHSKKKLIM
ncbi:hypothetical protein DFH28DRAFT_944772 [Melampsora americana]|nr:hypothetical protein DFH28DRAFT_944772 [Melampsora americana]